ncbi:MAG: hypothetical protein AAF458_20785 [Pseudomonadota bacterium]
MPPALIRDLSAIVDRAERNRSADRALIQELRSFIDQHDRPWTRAVVTDEFRDGDYTRSPTWNVIAGQFQVDRRYGLYSRARAASNQAGGNSKDQAAQLAAQLIGSLLQQGLQNQGGGASTPRQTVATARIETSVNASSVFLIEVDLSGLRDGTDFSVLALETHGVDQGYRLTLSAGTDGAVELARVTSRGSAIIQRVDAAVTGGANARQRIGWSRNRSGRLQVRLNGRALFDVTDRSSGPRLARVALAHNGEIGVSRVSVTAAH